MSHVPLYVYVLFVGLMYWGFKSCFERTMRVERLLLLPLFFIFFSLRSIMNLFHGGFFSLLLWFVGVTLGILPGYLHVRNRNVRADHAKRLVRVPGDWTMLVLIIFVFAFEFFVHYCIHAEWPLSRSGAFLIGARIILGFISGMAIGRNATTARRYAAAPNEELRVS